MINFYRNSLVVLFLFYFMAKIGAQSSPCAYQQIHGYTLESIKEMAKDQEKDLCCDDPKGSFVIPVAAHVIKGIGETQPFPTDVTIDQIISETNVLLAPHFTLELINNFYDCASGTKVFRPQEVQQTITIANEIQIKNLSRVDPTKVMNLWFVNDLIPYPGQYAQGWAYSPIPNPTFPDPLETLRDGIVLDKDIGIANYAKVLAHEFGHYLSLHHVWGPVDQNDPMFPEDLGNCNASTCTQGDEIEDTPFCKGSLPNVGFPIYNADCTFDAGHVAALTTAGFPNPYCTTSGIYPCKNIMSYQTNRDEFTDGQFCRMIDALGTYRSELGTAAYADCLEGLDGSVNTSFENNLGAWTQVTNDDINWTSNSGSTSSPNTGPSAAYDGNRYLYTESSGSNNNKTAQLLSPFVFLTGNAPKILSFGYHMYGATMGSLAVEISTDQGYVFEKIWEKSGNQGDLWYTANISLNQYSGQAVQLRITGRTGPDWRSDMAIDDIQLGGACSIVPSTILVPFPKEGGTEEVTVASNGGSWQTSISASQTWASLSAITSYSFKINALPNTGVNPRNTSVYLSCGPTIITITVVQAGNPVTNDPCGPSYANIPNNLTFESTYLNGWTQDANDDMDWTRQWGNTPSQNTGPSSAKEGQYYMFTEATGNFNKEANLISPCYNLANIALPEISFSYHMWSGTTSHVGAINLQVSENGGVNWTTLWTRAGSSGNLWRDQVVSLDNYKDVPIQLRFHAITGPGYQSDMAIDDVQVRSGACYDPYESNNTFQTAFSTLINSNVTYDNVCLYADDYDYYRFVQLVPNGPMINFFVLVKGANSTVNGRYELTVDMMGGGLVIETHPNSGSTTDTEIFLYDKNGVLKAQDDNGGQGNFSKIFARVPMTTSAPRDTEEFVKIAPSFDLRNYPNPFNQMTNFDFFLEKENSISLIITDLSGKEVARPINDTFYQQGNHKLEFDASALPAGVYNYSLITEAGIETKQMVIIR